MTDSVVIERTLKAPIATVWDMWTVPENFQAWYGPGGAKIPVANMDLQVGGSRLVCMEMETPDGPMKMWFGGEFTDVTPVTRLAYTETMTDESGNPTDADHSTEVIVELTEIGASETKMVLTHVGVPADSPGAMGWNMAIDKLEAHLA